MDLILIEQSPYRIERSRASPFRIGAHRIDPYKIDPHRIEPLECRFPQDKGLLRSLIEWIPIELILKEQVAFKIDPYGMNHCRTEPHRIDLCRKEAYEIPYRNDPHGRAPTEQINKGKGLLRSLIVWIPREQSSFRIRPCRKMISITEQISVEVILIEQHPLQGRSLQN